MKILTKKEVRRMKEAAKKWSLSKKEMLQAISASAGSKESMMDKDEIKLSIGTRARCIDFCDTYQPSYLIKNGWNFHKLESHRFNQYLRSVKTKYGEIVVDFDDVLTYVGDGVWDVRSSEKDQHRKN